MRLRRLGLSKRHFLLPVPHLLHSIDEALGCGYGSETFNKGWAQEVLTKYVETPDADTMCTMEVDIKCPISFVNKFFSEILPQRLPYYNPDSNSYPVNAYAGFEDTLTGATLRLRSFEPKYFQDLFVGLEIPELYKKLFQLNLHIAEQFESSNIDLSTEKKILSIIEPDLYPSSLLRDAKYTVRGVRQILDDVGLDVDQPDLNHHVAFKTFELRHLDSQCKENMDEVPFYRILEGYATTVVPNQTKQPTGLADFDSQDVTDQLNLFVLNKCLPKFEPFDRQDLNEKGSRNVSEWNSWLADAPLKSVVKGSKSEQVRVIFELPEVIEELEFCTFWSLKLSAYTADLINPSSVVLADIGPLHVTTMTFDNWIALPELTLDHSHFSSLPVPCFRHVRETSITEVVFKDLSRTKIAPSISASDRLYLDWHMSQVGLCTSRTCFRLRRILTEDQLREPIVYEKLSENKSISQLLLKLVEDSYPRHLRAEVFPNSDCYEKDADAAVGTLPSDIIAAMPDPGSSAYIGLKLADNYPSDQSVLTDENNDYSMLPQSTFANVDPASMTSVLSLMKQARKGAISLETKLEPPRRNGALQDELGPSHNVEGDYWVNLQSRNRDADAVSASGESTTFTLRSPEGIAPANYSPQLLRSEVTALQPPACPQRCSPQTASKPAAPEDLGPELSDLEDIQISAGQGPHAIVIANLLRTDGPILCQRRSSYQKILGLDNEDLQVVERERELPLELILSPSTYLIIYNKENLNLHSDMHKLSSEEVLFQVIDRVVDCHIKAMSFSFQRCFMILEGEPVLTLAVLHIMDRVYTAAARCGMRLQCFLSTDSNCTDDLILKCIKRIWRTAKRPFDSPMSDILTDGEVFLAKFPPLNPLTVHAILCLPVPLVTFMSWSHEQQVSALRGFEVPTESLKLFHSQCEYGKIERSVEQQMFSTNPWPPESEIGTVRNDCDKVDVFPYFPPASEVIGELEKHYDDECERPEQSHLYSPFRDTIQLDISPDQGNIAWDDPQWQAERAQSLIVPCDETSHFQLRDFMQERRDSRKSDHVRSYLQKWLQRTQREKQSNLEAKPEFGCGSSRQSWRSPLLTQTRLATVPPWAPTPLSTHTIQERETNRRSGEPPRDPCHNKRTGKRTSSFRGTSRQQAELLTPIGLQNKKLEPPARTRGTRRRVETSTYTFLSDS